MSNMQTKAKIEQDTFGVSSADLLKQEYEYNIIEPILNTREARQSLGNALPDLLSAFSGNSQIKKYFLRSLGSYLIKSLSRPTDKLNRKEFEALFENEKFVREIFKQLPGLAERSFDILGASLATIEKLSINEKKAVLGKLLSNCLSVKTGTLINRFLNVIRDIQANDPGFLSKTLGPGLTDCIDQTDFGDLKASLETALVDIFSLTEVALDALFEKPAKIVVLLSIIPSVINTTTKTTENLIRRFNEFPPDLVTDVILSLFREVDAQAVGTLSNDVMELVRQVTVGSALLGDPGMPQSRIDVEDFIKKFSAEIDLDLVWKFKEAVALNKERFDLSMLSILKKNPDMVIERLKNAPNLGNYKFKSANQKLSMLENMPENKTFAALAEGVSKVDTNLIADWINLSTILFNRLNTTSPDLLPNLTEGFTSTLDLDEIEDAANWVAENLGEPLKPLGRAVMPSVAKMIAEWISPNGNEYDEELSNATKQIRQIFNQKEVAA